MGHGLFALLVIFTLAGVQAAQAQDAALVPPDKWFVYTVIIVVFVIAFVVLGIVRAAVANSNFSLGDALSEEAEVTAMEKDAAGNAVPRIGNDGKPVTITVMTASVSRVIAFLGTLALLVLFIGFGTFVMYYFATGQGAPKDLDKIINFLIAGLTLFAPYVVNKFSGLFDTLQGRKP